MVGTHAKMSSANVARFISGFNLRLAKKHNATFSCGAISIQAEGKKLLEKHAIAPSAARLCYAPPIEPSPRIKNRASFIT